MNTINKLLKEMMRKAYLDWVNNYLTVETMAEDYGVPVSAMNEIINMGRHAHENYVSDLLIAKSEGRKP